MVIFDPILQLLFWEQTMTLRRKNNKNHQQIEKNMHSESQSEETFSDGVDRTANHQVRMPVGLLMG